MRKVKTCTAGSRRRPLPSAYCRDTFTFSAT
jgi:hypothetical protein